MAITASRLIVDVNARVKNAERDLDHLSNRVDRMGSRFGGANKAVRGFTLAAAAGFASLGTQAAAGGIVQATAALAPLISNIALLPGLVAGAASSMAVLKVGTAGVGNALKAAGKDADKFNEAIKGLSPNAKAFAREFRDSRKALDGFKNATQDALFSGLDKTLAGLIHNTLPALKAGFVGIASEMNGVARETGAWAQQKSTIAGFKKVLDDTKGGFAALAPAIKPGLNALLGVVDVGTGYLPRLSKAVADLARTWETKVNKAVANGSLNEWIDAGITAAKQLGGVLGNVGGILKSVFAASDGGGLLGNLEKITGYANDFLKSFEGQQALSTFFDNTGRAMATILPLLGSAAKAIAPLSTALANLATGVGPGVGDVLDSLATSFKIMAPSMTLLGQAVGSVLSSIAPLLPPVAALIAALTTGLAPILAAIGPELVVAAGAFMLFKGGVDAVQSVTGTISDSLDTYKKLSENLGQMKDAAKGAWDTVRLGAMYAGDAVKGAASFVRSSAAVVAGWARQGAAATISAGKQAAAWALSTAGAAAKAVATFAVTVATTVAGWAMMGVQALINAAKMAAAWVIAMGPVGWVIAAVIALVALIIANWDTVKRVTVAAWTAVSGALVAAWNGIKSFVSGAISAVVGFIQSHWQLLIGIFLGPLGIVLGLVIKHFGAIKGAVSGAIGAVVGFLKSGWSTAKSVTSSAWNGIKGAVSSAVSGLLGFVRGIPGRIRSALGSLGSLLYGSGKAIIQGLINGITNMAGRVYGAVKGVLSRARNLLPFSPAKEGPFSGKGWTLYSGRSIGQALADGLAGTSGTIRAAALGAAQAAVPPLSGVDVPGTSVRPSSGRTAAQNTAAAAVAPQGSTMTAGATFQFVTYNPISEPQSQTTNRALQRVAALGMV